MLGNKILLTYKRKRLSTKLHVDETYNLHTDGKNGHPHTNLVKHDGRSEKHSLEFQKIKSGDSVRCIICNDRDSLVHCNNCGQPYHLGCLDPSQQAIYQGKSPCLTCVRQQDSSACLPEKDSGKLMARIDIEGSDPRQLRVNPDNLDLSSPGEGASKSNSEVSIEMCSESMPKLIKVDSIKNSDATCVCDVRVSDERLIHTLTGMNTEGNSVLSGSRTSPVQAKTGSTMITFSRRRKRKKDVDVSLGSRASNLNERMTLEGCSLEFIPESKVSVDDSNGRRVVCQNLADAKHMSSVEACGESTSEAKTDLFGNQNKSEIVSSIANARPEAVDSCLAAIKSHEKLPPTHFESSLIDVVKVSSYAAMEKSESETYRDDSSANDKATKSNFLRATHLKPETYVPENSMIGLNLNLPVQTTGLPGSSSPELLQMSNGIIDDSQSVPCAEVSRVESTSAEDVTSFRVDKGSLLPMPVTLKKSCLQLFSDDNPDGSSSPAKIATANCMVSQEREILQLPIGNDQARESSRQSLLSLGLSLSTGPKNAGHDLPNYSSVSSLSSTQPRQFIHDAMLLSSLNQTSSHRHKLMLDSIVNRARGLNTRTSFQEKTRLYTAVWPEEELDFLWVGVRRHGRGNWDAMLRDSKLQFAPWRVPRDLAEKWDEEQSKLFSGTEFSQHSHPKGQLYITNYNNGFWPSNTRPRKENLADNTLPYLGDGYADQTSHVPGKPCLNSGNHQNETAQLQGPRSYQMRTYHSGCQAERSHGVSFSESEIRFQSQDGPLSLKYPASNLTESDRLPHWLREVVSTPTPRMEPSPSPKISSVTHSGTLQLGHSDSHDPNFAMKNSGIICSSETDIRRSDTGCFNSSAGMRQKPAGLGRHSSLISKPRTGRGGDVIVIDSDASSEETISDNCGR